MRQIKDKKIINVIRQTVLESVQGLLNDPDYGLELRDSIKRRLQRSKTWRGKIISFEEIRKKYL